MNGSIYERELMAILSGNGKVIGRVSKKLDFISRESYHHMENNPFYVTRAAGSKGADIVATRYDISMVIEVKSSQFPVLTFSSSSGKNQEQAERVGEKCSRSGLFLTYAFRLKNAEGDPWMVFRVPGNPRGNARRLYGILPEIEITKNKNFVMKWERGFPLHSLLQYLKESE
ncbi:MAG: hypothetical protein M1414_02130 [Candidatus Thermoplasmatota archaeon]|nr:hypothetical protein [Candidatus Thermoplasmatota archaeon]MCL5987685.1 hypothetical protein [Candidatus Thermoplasmatota archaeon]